MFRALSAFVIAVSVSTLIEAQETQPFRKWSDPTGEHSITARFDSCQDGLVSLQKRNEKFHQIKLEQLSQEDQDYIVWRHLETRSWTDQAGQPVAQARLTSMAMNVAVLQTSQRGEIQVALDRFSDADQGLIRFALGRRSSIDGDWITALPLLANSSAKGWRDAAQAELDKKYLDSAALWSKLAATFPFAQRAVVGNHAVRIYALAAGSLAGLAKEQALADARATAKDAGIIVGPMLPLYVQDKPNRISFTLDKDDWFPLVEFTAFEGFPENAQLDEKKISLATGDFPVEIRAELTTAGKSATVELKPQIVETSEMVFPFTANSLQTMQNNLPGSIEAQINRHDAIVDSTDWLAHHTDQWAEASSMKRGVKPKWLGQIAQLQQDLRRVQNIHPSNTFQTAAKVSEINSLDGKIRAKVDIRNSGEKNIPRLKARLAALPKLIELQKAIAEGRIALRVYVHYAGFDIGLVEAAKSLQTERQ